MNLRTKMIKESLFPLTRVKFLVLHIEKDLVQIKNIYENPLSSLIENFKDISDATRIEYVANLLELGVVTDLKSQFTNLDSYHNLLGSSYDKFLKNIDQSHAVIVEELSSYKDLLQNRISSNLLLDRFSANLKASIKNNSIEECSYRSAKSIKIVNRIIERQAEILKILKELNFIKNERIINAAISLSEGNIEYLNLYLDLVTSKDQETIIE